MSEVQPVALGDVVDYQTGFPFKSTHYAEAGIRLLRGDNIAQGNLRWNGAKFWPDAASAEIDKFGLQPGDIVLAMDRPWIEAGLKYASVRADDLPALLVQRVARLRGTHIIYGGFLRYLIGSSAFTEHILNITTGTAVPHISGKDILSFQFELPPMARQREIAAILGALDDKIEVNCKASATLEEMARALYHSWFVDFDPVWAKLEGRQPAHMDAVTAALFPDSFNDNGLPVGWSERGLSQIADFLNGAALQKYPAAQGVEYLTVIKIPELRNGISPGSGKASCDLPERFKVADGDILFSWSGSLLQRVWTGGAGALNQHLFKVTSTVVPKWFHYFAVDYYMEDFRMIAASKATTMGHIQRHHLDEAKITLPSALILNAADRVIAPLFDRMVQVNLESRTLATMRDTLLPRLMSGELRVGEARELVEEVA